VIILDGARHLGAGRELIEAMQRRYLGCRYTNSKLEPPRRIAINGIAVAQGQR
jgi:hypothetical protein